MGNAGIGGQAKRAARSARRAARSVASASQSAAKAGSAAAKAGSAAAGGAARTLHRLSGASGASRTGLAHLIELSAAGSAGDGFVAVALAGTLFFSTSVTQARGRVALALIVTMAPFALLAPFVGPALDRVRQGRRYILAGTVLARGLLCWGMSSAALHGDAVTLFPAAFGVLLLQKAYGVTRASVTPRLLPREITLVTANARCALASLIATSVGVPVAAGIDHIAGGGGRGAAWVLGIATLIYLAAIVPALRLPDGVDDPAESGQRPAAPGRAEKKASAASAASAAPGARATASAAPARGAPTAASTPSASSAPSRPRARLGRRALLPPDTGPAVREAVLANVTFRAYSGFMIFFLAFLLRTIHFHVATKFALGAMIIGVAVGGLLGTAIGAGLRSRMPQLVMYVMLAITTLVTAVCAAVFGLWAAVIVAFTAAAGQTLVKLAVDSIVQREVSPPVRPSTFAASETLHQLSWVVGGLLGLLMSLTGSGVAGMAVAAAGLAISLASLLSARRTRILRARRLPGSGVDVVRHSA
jgi:hypothetical protein